MTWGDDPFNDSEGDRTIIRPSPGGRPAAGGPVRPVAPTNTSTPSSRPPLAENAAPKRPQPNFAGAQNIPSKLAGSGLNPLVDAATALLVLGSRLRGTLQQDNVSGMQEHVVRQIRVFEDAARSCGCEQNAVLTARYVLCTFLDEFVLKTPWGSESHWASQSLLSKFHNETGGGEKFFQLLDQLLQEPARNLNLLELMYLCLSFGFEGKYMLSERGSAQLMDIQDNLYRTLSLQRGDFERELSPRWQGIEDGRAALVKYIPLWVVAALAGVLLLVVYGGFRFILGTTSAPVYQDIEQAAAEQRIDIRE